MRRALATAIAVALALALPAVAIARRPAPGSYVGVLGHGGVVELAVAPGGRTIQGLTVVADPRRADMCPDGYSETFGRIAVSRAGRLQGRGDGVTGHVTADGEIHGTEFYDDRSGCQARDTFAVRRQRGPIAGGPRAFDLYGDDDDQLSTRRPAPGLPATRVGHQAYAAATLPDGTLLVADSYAGQYAAIAAVAPTGRARVLVGGDGIGRRGDGGPASRALLNDPEDVAALPDGGYLIADAEASCVREVDPAGIITTVAGRCAPFGTGRRRPLGDGGPATRARLRYPCGLAVLPDGGFLIADELADRVREVSPSGVITTFAGDGRSGLTGNGGPATRARLNGPTALAVLPDGAVLIADTGNGVVREVSPVGIISTVAGGGHPSLAHGIGDGGPATAAVLDTPSGLLALPGGGFLVADDGLGLIREVTPGGTISTIAGGGALGLGAPALDADLGRPGQLAALPDGGIAVADLQSGALQELAPATTTRLLLAITRATRTAVTVRTTVPASLTVKILSRTGRVLARSRAVDSPTVTSLPIALPRSGPRGAARPASVRVIARAGARITTASAAIPR